MRSMWACAAAVIGVASGALGVEPEGDDVMREMAKTVAEAGSLTFDVHVQGVGSLSVVVPRGTVRARIAPGEDGAGSYRYKVEGEVLAPGTAEASPLAFAYDGELVRALDVEKKLLIEGAPGDEDESVPFDGARPFRWLWRWDVFVAGPYLGEESPYSATWLGKTVINGATCDIVRVDYSERADVEELDLFWYVGEEDRLPRRVEATYFFGDGSGLGIATISNHERATMIESGAFAIEAPEGYEVQKGAQDAGGGAQAANQPAGGVPVGDKAPAWTLMNAAGEEVTLESLRGKVVLMDFWATWCGPCKAAMPGVQALHEELGDRGLVVLGMNCWDDPEAAVAYMEEKGFTYTTMLNADQVAGAYGVSGIPTFYVIGPDGRVEHHEVGFRPGGEEALKELLVELLPEDG